MGDPNQSIVISFAWEQCIYSLLKNLGFSDEKYRPKKRPSDRPTDMATEGRKKQKGQTDIPTDEYSVVVSDYSVGYSVSRLVNWPVVCRKGGNFLKKGSLSDRIFRRTWPSDGPSNGIFRGTIFKTQKLCFGFHFRHPKLKRERGRRTERRRRAPPSPSPLSPSSPSPCEASAAQPATAQPVGRPNSTTTIFLFQIQVCDAYIICSKFFYKFDKFEIEFNNYVIICICCWNFIELFVDYGF